MAKYYSDIGRLLVAVDCLIFGYDIRDEQLKALLFKRKVKPLPNRWSLVGSFVKEDEDLRDAATRVLEEFTGLNDVFLKQLKCYGKIIRDPGARVISMVYWSLIPLEEQKQHIVNSHGAKWFDVHKIPEVILDHNEMIETGLHRIRNISQNFPIGKELLPEFFTLPQLYQLYTSIYKEEIDDRNFRKKLLSTGLLLKQAHKDRSNSKKGAHYYKFDEDKYNELLETGYRIIL